MDELLPYTWQAEEPLWSGCPYGYEHACDFGVDSKECGQCIDNYYKSYINIGNVDDMIAQLCGQVLCENCTEIEEVGPCDN